MAIQTLPEAVGVSRLQQFLQERPPARILVMLRDYLGDVVNSTGAVYALAERFPEAHITVELGAGPADLIRRIPGVNAVWVRRKHEGLPGKVRFVQRVRRAKFDLGVMFDDSNEMIRHLWLAGVPLRVGVHKTKHIGLFTASVPFDRRKHDLFPTISGVLGLFGINHGYEPRIEITPDEAQAMTELARDLFSTTDIRIGIHVGASVPEKMWPLENFAGLVKAFPKAVVLYGPGEESLAQRVGGERLPHPLSLFEYAAFVSHLHVLITNDTGPAHIAAAMGTPQIVIYGPTTVERFGPFGHKTIAMQKPNACDYYAGACEARQAGLTHCDRRCLARITVDEVTRALEAFVS